MRRSQRHFYADICFLVVLWCMVMLVVGCSTVDMPLDKEKVTDYKADARVTVGGKTFDGMAAALLTGPLDVVFQSVAKTDIVYVHTCARFERYKKTDKSWFGGSSKPFPYRFEPSPDELEGRCPLYWEVYDLKGLTDWGMVAFRTDQTLPGEMWCNGRKTTYAGFSVCQTKDGLEQTIIFDRDVTYSADPGCNMKKVSNRKFKFYPALGFCHASFKSGNEFHDMMALGFKRPLLRE